MADICILTPLSDYGEDWTGPQGDYRRLFGDRLAFRAWHDAGDLTDFALVMPLIAWGYHLQPGAWFAALDAWEAQGIRFANHIATLRWNSHKRYLLDLEARGVAIVPTILSAALSDADLAAAGEAFGPDLIVKPPISGGAHNTFRLRDDDPLPAAARGGEMMIQPTMPGIATEGEYSLFHFAGHYSHAIVKRPATGDFRVQEQFGGREETVVPPVDALALAQAAIAAAPSPLLYARSDMVRDGEGTLRLMELELVEPALFLDHSADRGAFFADEVAAASAS